MNSNAPHNITWHKPCVGKFAVGVLCFVLFLMAGKCGTLMAEEQSNPSAASRELQTKTEQLLSELTTEDQNATEKIAAKLIELGPDVLPFIPETTRAQPLAIRAALERVRRKLQKQKSAATLQVSRMSFTGSTTLLQLLTELEKQTENDLDWSAVSNDRLSSKYDVQFRENTFWNVITWLEDKAGLQYQEVGKLTSSGSESTGPKFRVEQGPLQVEYGKPKQKNLIGQPDEILWRVPVKIRFEPRLRPLYLRWKGNAFVAKGKINEKEVTLDAFNPAATIELSAEPEQQGLKTQLDFVGSKSDHFEELVIRGKFELVLAAGHEEVAFDFSRENTSKIKRVGSAFVELINSKEIIPRTNQQQQPLFQQVVLRVKYSPRVIQAFESHRTWMFYDPVWLELGDGNRVHRNELFETVNQYPGEITVGYNFSVSKEDFSQSILVYRIPTLVTNLKLEINPVKIDLKKR